MIMGKQNVKMPETGMCECGHPKDKHRDRGSCRKCGCKQYYPGQTIDGKLQPVEHEKNCHCAECAWTRLIAIEKAHNLLVELHQRDALQFEDDIQQLKDNFQEHQNILIEIKKQFNKMANAVGIIIDAITEPKKKQRKAIVEVLTQHRLKVLTVEIEEPPKPSVQLKGENGEQQRKTG